MTSFSKTSTHDVISKKTGDVIKTKWWRQKRIVRRRGDVLDFSAYDVFNAIRKYLVEDWEISFENVGSLWVIPANHVQSVARVKINPFFLEHICGVTILLREILRFKCEVFKVQRHDVDYLWVPLIPKEKTSTPKRQDVCSQRDAKTFCPFIQREKLFEHMADFKMGLSFVLG